MSYGTTIPKNDHVLSYASRRELSPGIAKSSSVRLWKQTQQYRINYDKFSLYCRCNEKVVHAKFAIRVARRNWCHRAAKSHVFLILQSFENQRQLNIHWMRREESWVFRVRIASCKRGAGVFSGLSNQYEMLSWAATQGDNTLTSWLSAGLRVEFTKICAQE